MKLLTLARDLRRRKARERQGLFVAEGVRGVEELLASPIRVHGVLAAPALERTPRGAALLAAVEEARLPVLRVSDTDLASAADTDTPQGVLAVAAIPRADLDALPGGPLRLLVLDAVQDPGNVGTILRTAAAFGVAATIALPGTVDLWNAKVVRSAMGALFHRPTFSLTTDELGGFLRARDVALWGADAHGDEVGSLTPPSRLAVAVGNEGAGLTPAVRALAGRLVSIPISGDVESLNVAVAAGILLHRLHA